ncbi:hypothetical protein H5410_030613, partial [Solanum commersonii]
MYQISSTTYYLYTSYAFNLNEPSTKKAQVIGELGDGLYLLKPNKIESKSDNSVVSFPTKINSNDSHSQ